eukprot:GHVO01005392.1.p1 GENE.GHVO01005392.1~~GHVO01005392.1.p1  ORF type:complete len:145 (-),score=11.69 GHVO01005392.1:157-591(-)
MELDLLLKTFLFVLCLLQVEGRKREKDAKEFLEKLGLKFDEAEKSPWKEFREGRQKEGTLWENKWRHRRSSPPIASYPGSSWSSWSSSEPWSSWSWSSSGAMSDPGHWSGDDLSGDDWSGDDWSGDWLLDVEEHKQLGREVKTD